MNADEIRKMDKQTILKKIEELRVKVAEKRMEKYIGKEKNVAIIRSLKKDIARMLTVLKEKEVLDE